MSRTTRPPLSTPAFLAPRPRLLPLVIRGVAVLIVVVVFGLVAARSSGIAASDLSVSRALNALHTGALGSAATAVYSIFGPAPAIVITVIVSAVVWLVTRNWRQGITFGVIVAVTWLPSAVVKELVHRARPDAALLPHPFSTQPTDPSYPSGHAVFITALVVALILLTRGHRSRVLVGVLGGLLVTAVALALVIDGVHFSTDVLASVLWSVGLAPLVLEVWNRVVIARTLPARPAAADGPA